MSLQQTDHLSFLFLYLTLVVENRYDGERSCHVYLKTYRAHADNANPSYTYTHTLASCTQ